MARIKVRSEFLGKGAITQAQAILIGALGIYFEGVIQWALILVAVVLFFYGSSQGQLYVCSECGNTLDHRKIKVCPSCGSDIS